MQTKNKNKIFIFWAIIFAFFLKAKAVFALESKYPTIFGVSLNDTNATLPQYAKYFFNIGIALAAFIAVAVIAFGGVYFLIDFARGKFADEGKQWIKSGILGLLLVMCAYLIVGTINPDLLVFRFGGLPPISLTNPLTGQPVPPNAQIVNYREIPLGILTENLLTKTVSCYGFDQEGNPVDYAKIDPNSKDITDDKGKKYSSPDYFIPTYTYTFADHDRADCLAQLADGAQKKAFVIAELSDEINKLMNTCSCANPDGTSKCDSPCNFGGGNNGCDNPPIGNTCTGACKGNFGLGAACAPFQGGAESCCDANVKAEIEHGKIQVGGGQNGNIKCDNPAKQYNGLDESRCPNPIKGAPITSCDGGQIKNFVEKQITVDKKTITIIGQKEWSQLSLVQQLNYFKQKLSDFKQDVQADITKIDGARSQLSKCYLAIPYIDLLKEYQNTDQNNTVILTEKTDTDAAKYCSGFNYSNSSCLKKCNDQCPDTSPDAISAYKNGPQCNGNDPSCLQKQENYIENAYISRPCTNGPDNSKTFSTCISSCQQDCSSNCDKFYQSCSSENKICKEQCSGNSQCIMKNAGTCLFGADKFINCAKNTDPNDAGNIQNCITNAYLCKNGSNEFSGYQECATSAKKCSTDFSSSFFYSNPDCQVCPNPADVLKNNSGQTKNIFSCQSLYPETAKCPASSKCPDCPCNQISETGSFGKDAKPLDLKFVVPNPNEENTVDPALQVAVPVNNAGQEGEGTVEQKILASQIAGPQCNNYSYNDDPLTFYCMDSWWRDPNREGQTLTPIGAERNCPVADEVPVGQTVDNAENWAKNLIASADLFSESIDKVLKDAKKISDKKPNQYCACDSKYDPDNPDINKANQPICTSNCKYDPPAPNGIDDNGNLIWTDPKCEFVPCKGDSCKQIMEYLSAVWNDSRQLKLDYIDFFASMLKEPRSDIMKQLTYSRQKTNGCSTAQDNFGNQERMLNCTRAEDEKIPSVINGLTVFKNQKYPHYCYGTKLGNLAKTSLTDNWFCCNLQAINNNPVK